MHDLHGTSRKSFSLRFGSRTLFLLIAVTAILLAVMMNSLQRRRIAMVTMRDAGFTMAVETYGPNSFRKALGDDNYFQRPHAATAHYLDDEQFEKVCKHMASFPTLAWLDMSESKITDRSAKEIRRVKSLRYLRLSSTRITDDTIAALVSLPHLQKMWLDGTQVTDASVNDLCQMQSLVELKLSGTEISPRGIARLRMGLRDCKIMASR